VLERITLLEHLQQLVPLVLLEATAIKPSKLLVNLDFTVILLLMLHSINSVLLEHTQLPVQVQLHVLNVMVVRPALKQV
jgi:hypothetical protein